MALYRFFIGFAACLLLPPLLIFSLVTGWQPPGLWQRFALYPSLPVKTGRSRNPRIWLHVASVGEARAALVFVAALRQLAPRSEIVLTAMTIRGRDVARRHLTDVPCFLAPLDVPSIVHRAIKRISPDLYITFESEMWPVTLHALHHQGCPALLINGRMTAKAARSWRRFPRLFRAMADTFAAMAVIGEEDRARFAALGMAADKISVTGNLKYDHRLTTDDRENLRRLREICAFGEAEVLLGGSTHAGEEKMLLAVWRQLALDKPLALLLAPRHLDRLPELREELRRANAPYRLFSQLAAGQPGHEPVIVVDSYGDLPILYGLADYIFIGGSLAPKGGHNPLEAAVWGKVVCHGPDVRDFPDIYRHLDEAGAAFVAHNSDELFSQISFYRQHNDAYRLACQRAGEIAAAQSGAAARQAVLALEALRKAGHVGQ